MNTEVILILDFGSPYTQLVAQKVRESHVFSRIVPYNISAKEIKLQKPRGIILSGSSATVDSKNKIPRPDKGIFKLKIPILGIGYGLRVIVKNFGGRVKTTKFPEFKITELFIDETNNLFWKMPNNVTCWMSYADYVTGLPRGFLKTAHTQDNPIAAIECSSKKVFAVAFHPEAVVTQRGNQIISNFLHKICGCLGIWMMDTFIKEATGGIKKTVGKKAKVVINLDTNLDSLVTALLINRVIKKRLRCIFIDNGLLRKDEAKQIRRIFSSNFHLNLKIIDRSKLFLNGLKAVAKTEEKKRVVSNLMTKIIRDEIKKVKGTGYLAVGISHSESAIKSILGNELSKLKRLQPLRDLFKAEIKVVAKQFGIPDNIIFRQPFGEYGLAMHIIDEVTVSRLKIVREAETILIEEIKAAGIYEGIWQSFAVLIPLRNVIAIRCVASTDGITADWVRLPYELLERISRRILTKVKGINRVVYDISPKPPASIEWE